jgi:hypothetical protein
MVIFDDLETEQDRLQNILDGLDGVRWMAPSGAAGWTVADVVLHLAQTEEAVLASATGASFGVRPEAGTALDEIMDRLVQAERAAPAQIFARQGPAGRAGRTARGGPAAAPALGGGAAEARHPGDHTAGRALGARPGYHRTAGYRLP